MKFKYNIGDVVKIQFVGWGTKYIIIVGQRKDVFPKYEFIVQGKENKTYYDSITYIENENVSELVSNKQEE